MKNRHPLARRRLQKMQDCTSRMSRQPKKEMNMSQRKSAQQSLKMLIRLQDSFMRRPVAKLRPSQMSSNTSI